MLAKQYQVNVHDHYCVHSAPARHGQWLWRYPNLALNLYPDGRRICEAVQHNLESGVYDSGRLSPRHENGVFAFHQWVRASLARERQISVSSSSESELMQ